MVDAYNSETVLVVALLQIETLIENNYRVCFGAENIVLYETLIQNICDHLGAENILLHEAGVQNIVIACSSIASRVCFVFEIAVSIRENI